ncbi:uncharacterized protein SEPMUDRAFT_122781, partial [Sphaerulina musiva SO2202]
GSNGKWLVLCEELFEEVCCEFTIRKLDLTPGEIRAIFDAEWVSQVTYELVTKPARPRRRNAQRAAHQFGSCSPDLIEQAGTPIPGGAAPSISTSLQSTTSSTAPATNSNTMCAVLENVQVRNSGSPVETMSSAHVSNARGSRAPTWFRTVLN